MNDYVVLVIDSPFASSSDGYWSGTEERHHQHYITVIPESRYSDPDEARDNRFEKEIRLPANRPWQEIRTKQGVKPKHSTWPPPRKRKRRLPKNPTWVDFYQGYTVRILGATIPAFMSGDSLVDILEWLKQTDAEKRQSLGILDESQKND